MEKPNDQDASRTPRRGDGGRWLPGASANPPTQFQPGQSGNPDGRPVSLDTELRKQLRENPEDQTAIVRTAIDAAKEGNVRYTEFIWQRIDGRMPEVIQSTGEHVEFLPPRVVEGRYLNDDSGGTDDDTDEATAADAESAPSPE